MAHIKVSVIIPIYNVQEYLHECLDSVLGQTLKEIEVICIDDGSTDKSYDILLEYQKKDSRVVVLQQENQGSGIARNKGLGKAKGEYIGFMDADDYYPSTNTLEVMYTKAKKNNVSICGGGISLNREGTVISARERGSSNYFFEEKIMNYYDVQFDYGYQRYIFSNELLKKNNIVFPPFTRFQDPPFLVKASLAAKRFLAIKEETYCYRWGHQNINWNFRRTNDMVRGISEVLQLSKENSLDILYCICINRINKEYYSIITNSLDERNMELYFLLLKLNSKIDSKYKPGSIFCYEECIIKPLLYVFEKNCKFGVKESDNDIFKSKYYEIINSKSFKISRIITYIPRKLCGGIRCLKEHGVMYTLRRVFEKRKI